MSGRPKGINVREWADRIYLWNEKVKEEDKHRKLQNLRRNIGSSYCLCIKRRWQYG